MKIQKKILIILIIISTLISGFIYTNPVNASSVGTHSTVPEPNFTIFSKGAVLMDASSGEVLYGKNENEKLYPASTTKILTAIIAIENCKPTDNLTASYEAVMSIPSGYSNAAIQPGETLAFQDLLDMFLIHSANEIGNIFAEHISGSIENFAILMNQKATEIGCKNTNFTNPSGIHDENHYSTAYDMALIARYCMQNETFKKTVAKETCTVEATDKYEKRFFRNTNDLLNASHEYYYEYAIGTKTGYTSKAKSCLISNALKDNFELISVTLGADSANKRYEDTINLFNYGFENYKIENIITKNTIVEDIVVENATKDTKNLSLLVKNDITGLIPSNISKANLDYSVKLNDLITAPINEGDVLGKIVYNIDGYEYSADLIANHYVEEFEPITIFKQIALALLVLFIIAKLILPKKKSKKKKLNSVKKKNYKKSSDSIYKFN